MEPEGSLPCSQQPTNSEALCDISQQTVFSYFYDEDILALRATPKLEDLKNILFT
jgi:hypothetical protein